jgi:hypothetical protein
MTVVGCYAYKVRNNYAITQSRFRPKLKIKIQLTKNNNKPSTSNPLILNRLRIFQNIRMNRQKNIISDLEQEDFSRQLRFG